MQCGTKELGFGADLEVREDERRHKSARGAVNVDAHVPPVCRILLAWNAALEVHARCDRSQRLVAVTATGVRLARGTVSDANCSSEAARHLGLPGTDQHGAHS